jgi:hypothetical protein
MTVFQPPQPALKTTTDLQQTRPRGKSGDKISTNAADNGIEVRKGDNFQSFMKRENCILYFLILLYYTYLKYWFDCILVRGTELYQHVLESVG